MESSLRIEESKDIKLVEYVGVFYTGSENLSWIESHCYYVK